MIQRPIVVITMLCAGLTACGDSKGGGDQVAPEETTSNFTPNEQPVAATGIDADFAGRIKIDTNGNCAVVGGNDAELVKCSQTETSQDRRRVEVDFSGLELENAPVCQISPIGSEGIEHNLSSIDNQRLSLNLSPKQAVTQPDDNWKHPPVVIPAPVLPTNPCDPLLIDVGGSHCGHLDGVIDQIGKETQSGSSVWPSDFVFYCKIAD